MKMNRIVRLLVYVVCIMMILTACGTPSAQTTGTPSGSTTRPSGTAVVTPTIHPTTTASALPTLITIPDVTDPGSSSVLQLTAQVYPRVDGSTATKPLAVYMRAKITGETLEQSDLATKFTTTGPSYLALANGAADLLVVYEAPQEIKTSLGDRWSKLTMKPIGRDALVFLTNEGNPVKNLTHAQLVDIYSGKIKRWNQVGGNDIEIIPYQRISNSGSQALMEKLVMQDTPMMEAPSILKPGDMDGLINELAQYDNTKNALGYSVYYYVRNMYQMPGIKILSVNGIAPNSETIASGKYPYLNDFYAVIRENEPADSPARKLFNWLTGTEGANAIKETGYVPVP